MQLTQKQNNSQDASKIIGTFALVVGFFLLTALPALAAEKTQYDDVYINGYKLGFFEQLALEDHIDRDVADGDYWLDLDTGMWGPVGEPVIWHIEIPPDYREYVESKLSNNSKAAQVDLAASTQEDCYDGCMYW